MLSLFNKNIKLEMKNIKLEMKQSGKGSSDPQ